MFPLIEFEDCFDTMKFKCYLTMEKHKVLNPKMKY